MLEHVRRFDLQRKPFRQHLGALILLLSLPDLWLHRNHLVKQDMEGIRPPYLLLCNHNAFMDFKVASRAIWPARANYVVAIDGFARREWLLRLIGCICTRKFTNDLALVHQLRHVVSRGDVAVIYPEARYSLCGTSAVLPGKLVRVLKVPVVTLVCHGHHINSPFYHLPDHGVKGTQALMRCIVRPEELPGLSHEEITDRIRDALSYDDFRWQKEERIRVTYPKRAEGLHKVLYQCPSCQTEYRMTSKGTQLSCGACGKTWELSEYGELRALTGETEFSHVPDWYEWERGNVRREVEEGRYGTSLTVHVDALPNGDGYLDIGQARLTHDMDGFILKGVIRAADADLQTSRGTTGSCGQRRTNLHLPPKKQQQILSVYREQPEEYEVRIPASSIYSCHIEYDYLGQLGDCVDLNTPEDTLYLYPEGEDFSVTKISLATEELYRHSWAARAHARGTR